MDLQQLFISPETAHAGEYTIATYLVEVKPSFMSRTIPV